MDFQQSQTYKNLQDSFQRESILTAFYLLNEDQARREDFMEIGNIFATAARNEKEHARIWQRFLNTGILPNTEENLLASSNSASGLIEVYRTYARIATEEGYLDIAAMFNGIANIEFNHDLAFRTQYNDVVTNQVFCKPEDTLWICMQCGNIMSGKCAPEICPVCGFPQGYYRVFTTQEIF